MIVAIDGEAGAGKTTVAALVAKAAGCRILESGSLYRALGWKALREDADPLNEKEITRLAEETCIDVLYGDSGNTVLVDGRDVTRELGGPQVGAAASAVGEIRRIRRMLLPIQRKAAEHGDLVAEGRDMGSVVFPEADFKFFLKASLDVRAQRRSRQMEAQGKRMSFEEIREQVADRDERDTGREWSPMRVAADAVVIDTSEKDAESVVDTILSRVGRRSGPA